jgi:hypothetical protein
MNKDSNKKPLLIALLLLFILVPLAVVWLWSNGRRMHVDVRHDNPSVSRTGGMAENIAKEVGMDSKQQQALEENMRAIELEMKAIQGDKAMSRDEKISKMQALMQRANESNEALMTPEQVEKYRAMIASGAVHN